MTVKEFMKTYKITGKYSKYGSICSEKRPALVCKDGFTISVQANEYCYCHPRKFNLDEYEEVELGFPNMADDLILDYAEDPEDPTETVYGYVPIELVEELVAKHGGIVGIRNEEGIVKAYENYNDIYELSWTPFHHELA